MQALPPPRRRGRHAWEKSGQAEQTNTVDLDIQRATVLAEALEEETRDGKITEKDIAEATGCHQTRIGQLLRYHRFLVFCAANKTNVLFQITEGRFREYWQQMSDPYEKRKGNAEKKTAYKRRVFLRIIEALLGAGGAATQD